MHTMYYSPGSCSLAVHAALVRTGMPHEIVSVPVRQQAHLTDAYRAINPRARVPALATPQGVITEVPAILAYLDRANPDARLLPDGAYSRAKALEWIAWFSSTVHPLWRAFWRTAYFTDDAASHPAIKAKAKARLLDAMAEVDAALATRDTFAGGPIGAVEFYAVPFLRWARNEFPDEIARLENLERFYERIADHPAVATAAEREGIALVAVAA